MNRFSLCDIAAVTDAFFVSNNGFYLWERASHAVKRVSDVFTYQTIKVCKEMHELIIKDQEGPDKCMSELYSQKGVRW